MATLKDKYKSELAPRLKEELGLDNVMEVPRITKITLNMGPGAPGHTYTAGRYDPLYRFLANGVAPGRIINVTVC